MFTVKKNVLEKYKLKLTWPFETSLCFASFGKRVLEFEVPQLQRKIPSPFDNTTGSGW